MTKPCLIADELGDIRALIRTLRSREAELRARILSARPNAPLQGSGWVVTVRKGTTRRIRTDALPDEIRRDPQYWSETPTTTVVTSRSAEPSQAVMLVE